MSLTTPSEYDVFPISMPAAETHIRKYKHLRLISLMLDPDAFSSTYERESQFTDETWRERVNGSEKVTVIARFNGLTPSRSDESIDSRPDLDPPAVSRDGAGSDEGTWVGLGTTVSPKMLRDFKFPFPKAVEGSLVYALNGVWVHPEHRKKGLARDLHRVTMEWIKQHAQGGVGDADKKIVLLVLVKEDNPAARALYTSMGYQDIGEEVYPGCLTLVVQVE